MQALSNHIYKTTEYCLSSALPIELEEIKLAKEFLANNYGSLYNLPPHLSLSTVPVPQYNQSKCVNAVSEYFSNKKSFVVKFSRLALDRNRNFFYLDVESSQLFQVHKEITAISNQFRDRCIREKDFVRLNSGYYSDEEAENINKYGFAHSMLRYQPHITIGNVLSVKFSDEIHKAQATLNTLLSPIYDKEAVIRKVMVHYHSDAVNQSDIEVLWQDIYSLS